MSCEVDFFNSHRWTITALSLGFPWVSTSGHDGSWDIIQVGEDMMLHSHSTSKRNLGSQTSVFPNRILLVPNLR